MVASDLPIWPFTLSNGKHPFDSAGIAILLGLVLGNTLAIPTYFQPGIKFSVKKILPLGIVLLGARLNMADLMHVGFTGILLSILEIVLAFTVLRLLGRSMKLGSGITTLLGVGTGICGGSAILAAAPVIEAEEEDVVFSVAVVSLLGTAAMFLFPLIGHLLGMPQRSFGLWCGLTLHQTPQVVAAGFTYGHSAGEIATIAKLARVCLLAPAIFIMGFTYSRSKNRLSEANGSKRKKINYRSLVPTFIIGLFVLVALRTMGLLPDVTLHLGSDSVFGSITRNASITRLCADLSTFFIVISMAAAGLETRISVLRKIGHAPLVAASVGFVIIASIILALVYAVPV
jgi:uncharacterized integral membrane protein (TIGR00698 family)